MINLLAGHTTTCPLTLRRLGSGDGCRGHGRRTCNGGCTCCTRCGGSHRSATESEQIAEETKNLQTCTGRSSSRRGQPPDSGS